MEALCSTRRSAVRPAQAQGIVIDDEEGEGCNTEDDVYCHPDDATGTFCHGIIPFGSDEVTWVQFGRFASEFVVAEVGVGAVVDLGGRDVIVILVVFVLLLGLLGVALEAGPERPRRKSDSGTVATAVQDTSADELISDRQHLVRSDFDAGAVETRTIAGVGTEAVEVPNEVLDDLILLLSELSMGIHWLLLWE